jgi:hypothetical protein
VRLADDLPSIVVPKTSRKSGVLTYPEPLGPPRPVAGNLYFTFILYCVYISLCVLSIPRTIAVLLGMLVAADHGTMILQNVGIYPLNATCTIFLSNSITYLHYAPIIVY